MKKFFIIGPVVVVLIFGLVALIRWDPQGEATATSENVTIENGIQFIDLTAKGGYTPRKTIAQAGFPTILQVNTDGTYDCSATISIPDQRVNQVLPASGTTDIDLGISKVGITQGTCGMGMYRFEIEFES